MNLSSDELEDRLTRWASWASGPAMGSIGNSVGYLKERLDHGFDSAEMTDEIAVTERAVAKTKLENKAFWRVISRYYLGGLAHVEIALDLGINEDRVGSLLLQARGRIADHISRFDIAA